MHTLAVIFAILGACYGQTDRCQKICTANYSPVCGSDHHTYSNMCHLQIAECQAKMKGHYMTLSHSGSCSHSSGSGSSSVHSSNPNCDTICDEEVSDTAVCASTGVTYASHCEYDNAQCMAAKQGVHISVRHTGQCTQHDLDCPLSCDAQDLSPVCSARNHTYRNMCYLKQLQCRYVHIQSLAAMYELAHNGSCEGVDPTNTNKMDCSQYESHAMVAVEGDHHHNVLTTCPKTYEPVCGTDLRTHQNLCTYCRTMIYYNKLGADHSVDVVAQSACPSYLTSYHIG